MNVSISYAVSMEDLPKEVKKLIIEARQKIEGPILEAFESAESDFDDENYFRILKSILEIREQLYATDARLQDCHSILTGYQKLLFDANEEKPDENQLSLDFEGSDVTMDEQGNLSLKENSDE